MSKTLLVALLGLALVAAQPAPPTRFSAYLNGAQNGNQVTSIGSGWLELMPGDMLMAGVAWDSTLMGVSAAHIHGPAMPGSAAGVLVTLEVNSAGTMANFTGAFPGSWNLTALAMGMYYFNVHNNAFPGGAIRGQIFPATPYWASFLTGANMFPTGSGSPALAKGGCTVGANNAFNCMIVYYNLADATVAHIHGPSFPNNNAPILFTFTKSGNTFSGQFTLNNEQMMWLGLGQLYLVVHSTAIPQGAIRGPLYVSTVDPMALDGVFTAPCFMSDTDEYTIGCINFSNGNGAYQSMLYSNAQCTTQSGAINFPNMLFAPYMQAATKGGWDNAISHPFGSGTLTFLGATANATLQYIKSECPDAVISGSSVTLQFATCSQLFELEYGNVRFNPMGPAISLTNFASNMNAGLSNWVIESTYTKGAYADCNAFFNPSGPTPNPNGNSASALAPIVSLVAALIAAVRLF